MKHIEVWNDDVSDASRPVWCVSLCWESGDEITCLSTHRDRVDAIAAGKAQAEKRGIELFERDARGHLVAVE